MKKNKHNNKLDLRLIDKCKKHLDISYYGYEKSLVQPYKNQFERIHWNKIEKKSFERFIEFIDMATDYYPDFCFVTGNYIPPRFKGSFAIKPFPKSPWCYESAYNDYINAYNVSNKLTHTSMLICTAISPDEVTNLVDRPRVINTKQAIESHIQELQRDDESFGDWSEFDWKYLRANFFIKPNGSPFTR